MSEIKVNSIRHNNNDGVVSIGNSAVMLPKGTTAQRPSGVAGQIRYNTTTNRVEFHNGTDWYTFKDNSFVVTGGSTSSFGAYTLHTFTSSGTLTVQGGGIIDIFVVAGGGQGGQPGALSNYGGGGGAGGLVWYTGFNVSAGSYSIVVGQGGAQTSTGSGNRQGNDGSDSTAFGLTAKGGGGGGGQASGNAYDDGRDGGSGGGGAYPFTNVTGDAPGGSATQPSQSNSLASGTLVYNLGNAGGGGDYNPNSGGGGGGAGGAGQKGDPSVVPHGGAGYDMSSSLGTSVGDSGWFCGGGGGSNQTGYPVPYGNGGSGNNGGAGQGGNFNNSLSTAGQANTGGGGGAGTSQIGGRGGGSGVVIVRYLTT
jgi:hypothetical protein